MKITCLDPENFGGVALPYPILEVSDEDGHSIKVTVPYTYEQLEQMLAASTTR